MTGSVIPNIYLKHQTSLSLEFPAVKAGKNYKKRWLSLEQSFGLMIHPLYNTYLSRTDYTVSLSVLQIIIKALRRM